MGDTNIIDEYIGLIARRYIGSSPVTGRNEDPPDKLYDGLSKLEKAIKDHPKVMEENLIPALKKADPFINDPVAMVRDLSYAGLNLEKKDRESFYKILADKINGSVQAAYVNIESIYKNTAKEMIKDKDSFETFSGSFPEGFTWRLIEHSLTYGDAQALIQRPIETKFMFRHADIKRYIYQSKADVLKG